jgi:hypothetical protein
VKKKKMPFFRGVFNMPIFPATVINGGKIVA